MAAASAIWLAMQLTGCVGGPVAAGAGEFLSERGLSSRPAPDAFDYCWDHSCNRVVRIALPGAQWSEIARPLQAPSATAEEERSALREVVAGFELRAAAFAGTSGDRGGTMTAYGAGGQLDCIDETANTTALLLMLDSAKLLRWHRPTAPAGRGNLVDGLLPHRTAAIAEIASGADFVVDSWFHDNGVAPEMVPLALWLSGWSPPEDTAVVADAGAPPP